ncbi:MAG TPA: peptidyl-prolyl cis-trans isomerase [Candidatus Omnitrophota bacterium]|nr:peptidyl-prolyl cis-trans isomerase [Candidatus Omnitrophota bacterium]HPD84322.1 peptidyl-prolyl cis-trans isomerase [Candidatus Omnitrophota bacterium]HRZ03180.1 peptidyl-prolyl cis-trans isomerase [Candidatus Omnitrophota bacterium]
MLKTLRKKGVAKKILWVVAIVIIISFGFFGTANYVQKTHNVTSAGKIFNRTVSFDEFEQSLMHARTQAMLTYGQNFDRLKQFLNLDSQAWDRIILLKEAKKQKIKVSDEEVVRAIGDLDLFKNQGAFDSRNYDEIVRYYFKCGPRDFEESIRDLLTFSKLREKVTSAITVTDEDIRKEYQKKNEKAQVSFVLVSADDYKKDVSIDEKEIEQYYAQNKDQLRVPPSINILYLHVALEADPKQDQPLSPSQKIQNIMENLKTNPDLEKVGQKYGLTASESGFFNKEQPDLKINLPYEALLAAFELSENQISAPIETPQGYYILKLKQKRDAYVPDIKEATAQIKETLATEKARGISKSKAEEYLRQIREQITGNPKTSFSDTLATLGLKVQQTPPFSRGQYVPGIGVSPEFQDTAFSLTEQNKISNVIEIAKGYCIIHLDSRTPIDEEKFGKEKEEFAKNFAEERKNQVFGDYLRDLRIKANLQDNISKLRKQKLY